MRKAPVCTALTPLLGHNQENPVFLVTDTMSQWDVTLSISPAPRLIQITGVRITESIPQKKPKLGFPVLAHGQAGNPSTDILTQRQNCSCPFQWRCNCFVQQVGDTRCHQFHGVGQSGDTKIELVSGDPGTPRFGDPLHTVDIWTPSLAVVPCR